MVAMKVKDQLFFIILAYYIFAVVKPCFIEGATVAYFLFWISITFFFILNHISLKLAYEN
jgi:hypothetical protein